MVHSVLLFGCCDTTLHYIFFNNARTTGKQHRQSAILHNPHPSSNPHHLMLPWLASFIDDERITWVWLARSSFAYSSDWWNWRHWWMGSLLIGFSEKWRTRTQGRANVRGSGLCNVGCQSFSLSKQKKCFISVHHQCLKHIYIVTIYHQRICIKGVEVIYSSKCAHNGVLIL